MSLEINQQGGTKMKRKQFLIIMLLSLLITGCSSNNYIAQSIYGEKPTIEATQQEFENNMFEYATKICQQVIANSLWKDEYNEILIGERIKTFGYENEKLVELKSPYYYPIFLENQLIMFVEIFNGENSPYVDAILASNYFPNFTQIDESAFYWRKENFYYGNNPYSQELIDGMFLVFDNNNYSYTFYCSKQHIITATHYEITIDDDLLKDVRAQMGEYNTYPLSRTAKTNDKTYIVENITATDLIKENKQLIRDKFKEKAEREQIPYKKVEVKDPLISYLYQVNVDLSTSFIQDVDDDLIYPIFVDDKYYCDSKITDSIIAGEKEVLYYISGISEDIYEKIKNLDYIIFHDVTYFSKGIITKDEIITTGANYYDTEIISNLESLLD